MSHSSKSIKARDLMERLAKNDPIILVDVRENIEYYTRNIGGVNIPLGQLINKLEELEWQTEDEIIVVCSKGVRSRTAQSILQQNGYQNVVNLEGGLLAIEKLQSV